MTRAYVLIKARAGKSPDVARVVGKIAGVKSAHTCWGQPDIFAFVEATDERALANLVLAKIQAVDGVVETDTHIVIES